MAILTDGGADVNGRGCDLSPLQTAAHHGHASALVRLLSAGASPSQQSSSWGSIWDAANSNSGKATRKEVNNVLRDCGLEEPRSGFFWPK